MTANSERNNSPVHELKIELARAYSQSINYERALEKICYEAVDVSHARDIARSTLERERAVIKYRS